MVEILRGTQFSFCSAEKNSTLKVVKRRFVLRFYLSLNLKGQFMKKLIACMLMLSLIGVTGLAQKKATPKTEKEKVSYSLGVNIGKNMKMQGIEVDQEFLAQGLKDALSNAKTAMSDKDMETTMNGFQQEMMTKMKAKQQVDGEKNKKEGEAFLVANKKKDGIITLPSGLQYKVIKMGDGPKPTSLQTVTCNYRVLLLMEKSSTVHINAANLQNSLLAESLKAGQKHCS